MLCQVDLSRETVSQQEADFHGRESFGSLRILNCTYVLKLQVEESVKADIILTVTRSLEQGRS